MPSSTLILLRHSKSSWAFSDPDHDRPLAERGLREGVLAGRVLSEYRLDAVRCSTAARTRQTWERAQLGGANCADVCFDAAIYDAAPTDLFDVVRGLPKSASTALVIGHETAMSGFILSLARPSSEADRVAEKFPTSAIAVLRLDRGWSKAAPNGAEITRYVIPRA